MEPTIQILHLEDDPVDAELVQARLSESGLSFHITPAATRGEFETILGKGGMDIILADYKLPMYDGMSALRHANEVAPDIPFIFVSGTMGEEAAIDALTRGATDYVLKHNLARLTPAVQRALEDARNQRARKQAEEQIKLLSYALDNVQEGAFLTDIQNRIVYVNQEACRSLEYKRDELLGMTVLDFNPDVTKEDLTGIRADGQVESITFETRHRTRSGHIFPVEITATRIDYGGVEYGLSMVRDITERKKIENERRLVEEETRQNLAQQKALLHMYQNLDTASVPDIISFVVDQCVNLSGSAIGFVGLISDDDLHMEAHIWSEKAMANCPVNKPVSFQINKAGLWAEAIRQCRPVIVNDYQAPNPEKKGYPDGHLELSRFMGVPVVDQGRVVAVAGVANRRNAYTEPEQNRVSLLLEGMWELIKRRRAEELSRKTMENLEEAQRLARIGSWELDLTTNDLTWSHEIYRMFEIDSKQFGATYEAFLETVHPDDREAVNSAYTNSLKTRTPYTIDHRLRLPDGRIKHVHEQGETFYEKDKPVRSIGTVQDVTERKQAEERLHLLNFALNNVRDAAFLMDENAHLCFVNEEACRSLGYSREELLGLAVSDFDPDFPMERLVDQWHELKARGALTFESRHKTKDGRIFPVEISANYFEYDGKSYNLVLVRDITERKEAEKRLTESEQRYRTLAENSPDNIARYDADCRTLYANPALEKTLGRPASELLGTTPMGTGADVPNDFREYREKIFEVFKTGKNEEMDLVIPDSGSGVQYHNVRFVAEREADGSIAGVLAVGRDITERKMAESERQANLRFFECMDRVNRIFQENNDFEGMLNNLLDFMLEQFGCDRVFLMYPCDPEAPSWRIPMEKTRPEYPGVLGLEVPMEPGASESLRVLLAADGPVQFGPESEYPLPPELAQRFGIKSLMSMVAYLMTGTPWQFGMHQCSYPRVWTSEEEKLFKEIGRRLGDALTSLQAVRDLQESEQRYRTLVENLPDFVTRFDMELRHIYVNPTITRDLKFPPEFFLGKKLSELPQIEPLGQLERVEENLQEAIDTGKSNHLEIDFKVCEEERFLEIVHIPEKNEKGTIVSVLGITRDITERKQAESERQANLRFFECMDRVNRIFQENNDFEGMLNELLDFMLEHFECDRVFLMHPCDPEAPSWRIPMEKTRPEYPGALGLEVPTEPDASESLRILLAADGPVQFGPESEYPLPPELAQRFGIKSLMSMVAYLMTGTPWQFGMHQCSYPRVWTSEEEKLFKEIGRRLGDALTSLQAVRDLRESEERYRSLVENLPDFIVRFDTDLRHLYVNPKAAQIADLPMEHIIGKKPSELPPAEPPSQIEFIEEKIREVIDTGKTYRQEAEWPTPEGERSFDIAFFPEKDERGKVISVLGITRDITERKRAEKERASHLEFLSNMDRINRAIQGADDPDQMVGNVLDTVLSIFDCDRAHLMHPCDPDADSFTAEVERCKPGYEGALTQGAQIPITPEQAETMRILLDADGPVKSGPGCPYDLPREVAERFNIKSFMSMALHPKIGKPWRFGLHQCAFSRAWTPDEVALFREISIRLADALTSLLAHRNIIESEERFRILFENSPVSIWEEDFSEVKNIFDNLRKQGVTDIEAWFNRHPETVKQCAQSARIIDVNRATLNLHGAATKEELMAGLVQTFTPESFETFRKELVCLWNGSTEMAENAVVKTLSGDPRYVTVYFSVCPGYEKTLTKVLVSIIDITERKQVEAEVERLKNYLANIIDSMPLMLAGIDPSGVVNQWNRQAMEMTGVSSPEAVGRTVVELFPDFSPWITQLQSDVQPHRSASMEKLLVEKEGERRFYDLLLYPLVADGIEGSVLCIEDVTEQTRIQEVMVQTEKMMSLGGLAAGMAHEINNPLGIITQAIQNIERRVLTDIPANREAAEEVEVEMDGMKRYFEKRQIPEFIRSIREASTRASRIIANILQFSRRPDNTLAPASIPEIIDRVLELAVNDYDLKKKYDFRSIDIHREYGLDIPLVPMIAVELEQVLLNLIKNAAQAMMENPPDRKPRIILGLRREDRYAVIEVADNGPGIPEEVRKRVFEPFFTTKEPGVGTGLGLSVAYTIITRNHKGLIEVSSVQGQGAFFTVRLPLGEKDSNHMGDEK